MADHDRQCGDVLAEIDAAMQDIAHREFRIADVYRIYNLASRSGLYERKPGENVSGACEDVVRVGSEFLQLAEAAERYQDSVAAYRSWSELIRQAAKDWLAERTIPSWSDSGGPLPDRH
jgi:hypothetical protein